MNHRFITHGSQAIVPTKAALLGGRDFRQSCRGGDPGRRERAGGRFDAVNGGMISTTMVDMEIPLSMDVVIMVIDG